MKFNLKKRSSQAILNHQGGVAYKMGPEMELYSLVVTSTLSNRFYETAESQVARLRKLVQQVDPEFVAKLAIYAREKMYLRSIPLVLTVELARIHRGDSLVQRLTERVIQRADEITELLAYYQLANKRQGTKQLNRLSKQLQKGIAAAFNKFDAYQFAKYNRKTVVSLKDALFLAHPKAKDEAQQAIFDQIVSNTLEAPYTWEVKLSEWGQQSFRTEKKKAKALKETWTELIQSNRLGYMALMRNLRNILQAEVSTKVMQQVADRLSDPEQVRRSKQLPFRFLSAYRELEVISNGQVAMLLDALEKAVRVSIYNLKGFDARTRVLLASDVSGSMYGSISERSKVRMYDIGLLLSMLLRARSRNVITGIFGDKWMTVNLSSDAILANTRKLESMEGKVGYSTNGHKVLEDLTKRRQVMDKVMFFTDLQMWDSSGTGNSLSKAWKTYRKQVAPKAKLYLFDLAGHGQTPLRVESNDVHLIAGWSDKVFEVMEAIEKGGDALETIRKIDL